VNGLNGIPNVPSAAGPTPAVVRADPRYQQSARLLRRLQSDGRLQAVRAPDGRPDGRLRVLPPESREAAGPDALDSLRVLLCLDSTATSLEITTDDGTDRPAALRLRLRSLLGAMFFLSQAVDVPPADVAAGLVTNARMPDSAAADWQALTGNICRIRSSDVRPARAFAAVRYRGHWFWVDDADLESKSTFGLLSNLFSLQSAQSRAAGPLLTVPAGQ
jgi:hypothetical protein